jgi:hypothetical protein
VLKQKLKKKPYATPSAKKPTHNPKTSLSFQKESQSNLLGRGNERINRILFTELSPNNGSTETIISLSPAKRLDQEEPLSPKVPPQRATTQTVPQSAHDAENPASKASAEEVPS